MADQRTGGSLAAIVPLAAVELRRWLPWRAVILTGASTAVLVAANLLYRSNAQSVAIGELVGIAMTAWIVVLALVVVATAQSVLAGDVEEGTAAWTLSQPVTRGAYVVAKFVASGVVVALAAVVLPGLIAYPVFANTASGQTDFGAAAVINALQQDPASFSGMPSLAAYGGLLALVALFAVFLVAMLMLFGTRLASPTALLGLGLATAAVVIVVGLVGWVPEGTPGVALVATSPGGLGEVSLLWGAIGSAVWSLAALTLAVLSFERRSL